MDSDAAALAAYFEMMGPMERRVLLQLALRLLNGQTAYGKLKPGKKDWRKEAKEEALDGMVYLACSLVEEEDKVLVVGDDVPKGAV